MTDEMTDTTGDPPIQPVGEINRLLTDLDHLQRDYKMKADRLIAQLNDLGPYYKIECAVKKRMPCDMQLITDSEVIGIFMDKNSAVKLQLLLESKYRRHANTDERQVHLRVFRMEPFEWTSAFQLLYLPPFEFMCERYLHHLNPIPADVIIRDMQSM